MACKNQFSFIETLERLEKGSLINEHAATLTLLALLHFAERRVRRRKLCRAHPVGIHQPKLSNVEINACHET